ncbi:NH-dependent NAD synthetase protein [Marine Group I thaumarchaeote SCGC RSA3]|uniref:NH-dependent NAD synthetase protein n=2 Tax=Marine Group I TaxID=905826 RepID=A0A087S2I2_9ARCH|nr:putative asparagine synthetase glutamine-hydrolyzing protein [Marine Group I thaumarchaeote SCGC AAA799-D11]KFM19936.1 NH-dependent NAD synthetase protein [Marine Group I thaumarchaeote SCGC RSA3]
MTLKIPRKTIRNLLTIRYNPVNPTYTPFTWKDLTSKNSDPHGLKTEKFLKQSIKKSFQHNDDPIAISLSSGIDSTLCLALIRDSFPDRKLFAICAVFSTTNNESKRANEIAKKFDAKFKILNVDSIFKKIPELVGITGKPRWNTYQHLISKEAIKTSKFLVTGDGADEIFGGYTFRYSKFLRLTNINQNWKTKTMNYLECHNRDWVPDQKDMFGPRINFSWKDVYSNFKPYFNNRLPPIEQVILADLNGKLLYDFIPTGLSISNYYKIKITPIFMDNDVLNFGIKIPTHQKYNFRNQKGKLILRKIAKRFGVDHIDEKKGFSPALFADWENHGKKICERYILNKDSNIFQKKLINYDWVLRAFEKIENDSDLRYLNKIISILALEIWLRLFISKEITTKHILK